MGFIGKILSFSFLHANQADAPTPTYASSAAFKAAIDTQAQQCQTAINSVIDQLNSVIALQSGAENLGSAPISGVAGATAYAQLVDLKAQINSAITGTIPDRSLANTKLILATLTGAEIANNTVSLDNVKVGVKNMITMGAMF